MQKSGIPPKIDVIWAEAAGPSYVRQVPDASQQPTFPYAASFTTGFPPDTFLPVGAGGSGPDGRDMNGILQQLSAWAQWQAAGGPVTYDGTFQSDVGGYPKGAVVASATTDAEWWLSTTDNNATNPDTGGSGWKNLFLAAAQAAGFVFNTSAAYIKFPSWLGGFIIQWTSVTAGAPVGVSWPIAFPNTCLYAGTQVASASTTTYGVNVNNNTPTGTTAYPNSGNSSATVLFGLVAFGY